MSKTESLLAVFLFSFFGCKENTPLESEPQTNLPNVENDRTFNEPYRDSIIAQSNSQLVIFHKSGTGLHYLLPGVQIRCATWTPNKRRILYSTPYELWLINADGSNPHKISLESEYILFAVASPSGTSIAYISIDTSITATAWSTGAIKKMNADGSGIRQLTPYRSFYSGLSWSPDSKSLFFISSSDGYGSVCRLTLQSGDTETLYSPPKGLCYTPTLSPDGSTVAFCSLTDSLVFKILLFTVSPGQLQQLTIGNSSDESPSWSPDGNALVYQRSEYSQSNTWIGSSIWLVQKDGSGNTRLTDYYYQCYDPFWR